MALAGAYVSEFLRTKKYGIGMRLCGSEDKGHRIGMCAALRKKRKNWHARSAGEKEQEWDLWRAKNKEWDPYALTHLSIPEDKVKG